MDIDLGGESDQLQKLSSKDSKSQLPKAVQVIFFFKRTALYLLHQELVTLVFDIERMKSAMLEFEIDLSKMPLGKLSKKMENGATNQKLLLMVC